VNRKLLFLYIGSFEVTLTVPLKRNIENSNFFTILGFARDENLSDTPFKNYCIRVGGLILCLKDII